MTMRQVLLKTYWWMERRLVPGLEYSQHHYEATLARWIGHGAAWLDVGCGRRLLPPWRSDAERDLLQRAKVLVGIDLDLGSLRDNAIAHERVFGPVNRLPFGDAVFDVVTANMVVEHLDDPVASFREVARVLRPGGLFLFHTPNAGAFPTAVARRVPEAAKASLARLLDGRRTQDVFPTFYRCNTPDHVRQCGSDAGLSVVDLALVSTTAVFSVIPPAAFVELLWLRFVQDERRANLRSNIIAVLRKN